MRGDVGLHVAAVAEGVVRTVRSDGSPTVHRVDEGSGVGRADRLVLDELGARGDLDLSRHAIDSVNMRALEKGS